MIVAQQPSGNYHVVLSPLEFAILGAGLDQAVMIVNSEPDHTADDKEASDAVRALHAEWEQVQ